MKILHLTRHLEIGGIPRYVVDLCAKFQAKGHEMVVASTGGAQVQTLLALGVKHLTIPLSSKFEFGPNLWRSWHALLPDLRKEKFDVVHAHTRIAQVLAHLIEKFHSIPSVTTCHGFFKPNLGRRLWPCWGQKVIAVSPAVRDHLVQTHRVAPQTIVFIPNGIDPHKFAEIPGKADLNLLRKKLGLPSEYRIIGTTARLCPVKGLEYLLEAFAIILPRHPDLFCLIAGDGVSRIHLEELARKSGISQKVVFAGFVQDVAPYLALMDIFVMPSLMEGLGLSILEAFAAEKPVVASRVGGIVNVVRDRKNGLLTAPKSAQEIASAIELLLTDPNLARGLAQKGKQTVERDFTLDRMADQVEEVYLSLQRASHC